jgi:hypothetical protein
MKNKHRTHKGGINGKRREDVQNKIEKNRAKMKRKQRKVKRNRHRKKR